MAEATMMYMPMLNEGTDVWRPVTAERLKHNTFRIVGSQPTEEEWAFTPGTVVGGRARRFADGTHGIAAVALPDGDTRLPSAKRDLILDEATALQIGLAVLRTCYGSDFVVRFEPYRAVLIDGSQWKKESRPWKGEDRVWAVMGDSPAHKKARHEQERLGPDHLVVVFGGGAPSVSLSPRDGRVLNVSLMR